MKIYKELETLGFFKWYCTQYGGTNYVEYKEVFDMLPLDNLIITKLNACIFKFFREEYNLHQVVLYDHKGKYDIIVGETISGSCLGQYDTSEEAELECIKKLIKSLRK